ncbi:MAG: hypothetical protein LBM93_06615 [Oscillospiraceae bacterium]|jgi:hypothetical protein|nr:hypothetical protein [Oscillospiraceae bacterium]
MNTKDVDFNAENTNSIFYYDGTATATIKIEEANFYSEDITIKVNDADYAVNWSKENDIYTAVLTFSEDGDYIIDIVYTDRSKNPMGNKNEIADKNPTGVYKSEQITIDTIDPIISVSYSPNNTVRTLDGRNYYDTVQTATVKITEHNFRADDVLATIKAVDSSNTAVSSNLISSLENHLKTRSSWTTNGDVHTTTLTYSNDANYSFDIEYTDLTLRKYDNYVEDLFTVDTTPPTNPTVQYSQNVFSNILNTITFGYYNEEVTVTISSVDETSGVYNFDYSAILSPNVSDVNKEIIEQAISESFVNYSNERRTATATFTIPSSALTASNQFNGTINCSATDRSNNNTDYQDNVRIVVDNIAPVLDVTYNEPYQIANNISYYPGDINATIKITEANFFSADVNVAVTKDGENYPVEVNWSDNNVNEHIGNFTLTEDGDYFIKVSYADRSTNKQEFSSNQLTIDTVKPITDITGIKDKSANNKIVKPVITYNDINWDKNTLSISLSGANNGVIKQLKGEYTDNSTGQIFTFDNFEELKETDDIYTLSVSLTDFSGNSNTQTIQFSVNRFGSNYTFSDSTNDINGRYEKEERDIIITETNVDGLKISELKIIANGTPKNLVKENDYTVKEEGGDGQWHQYIYTIKKSVFEQDGTYSVIVYSEDDAGNVNENEAESKAKELSFGIDKTNPVIVPINIDSDNRYNVDKKSVTFTVEDNLKLDNVSMQLNNRNTDLTHIDNNEYTIELLNSNDKQNLIVKAVDAAGNETSLEIKNVLVTTNIFFLWFYNTPLFIGSIIGFLLVISGIVLVVMIKKKKLQQNK